MNNSTYAKNGIMLGGIQASSLVLLGAGVIKTPLAPDLAKYLNEPVIGAVTIGSVTPKPHIGNTGVVNWPTIKGSYDLYKSEGGLHANGMYNLGVVETMNNIPHNTVKSVIISIAGYSTKDYVDAIRMIMNHKNASFVKAIEVNCSCPTMGCDPLAYSLIEFENILVEIKRLSVSKPLWFKLSPYPTAERIESLSLKYPAYDFSACPIITEEFKNNLQDLLKEHNDVISAIIISNGLPKVSRGTEIQINKENGAVSNLAGLSGAPLKELNLEMIKFLKSNGIKTDIVGCGGILTKKDISDYLDAGATAVQCTGGPAWGGVKFFREL